MEYHEKSVMVDLLMECHERVCGVSLHTRDDVGIGIRGSVENPYSANETNG